jgi:polyhydroxyalkanoate synthase
MMTVPDPPDDFAMNLSSPVDIDATSIASIISASQHESAAQHPVAAQHEPRPLPLFLQMLVEEAKGDVQFVQDVLAGVRAYQCAPRHPRPQADEILRVGRVRVTEFGSSGRPVLFVPSLINPPYVLDLAEENSLLRWLGAAGMRPMLLDWGDPRDGGLDLSISAHVEQFLLPVIEQFGPDTAVVGYCLGGTMSLAAAMLRPVAGLAVIAAPWQFDGYPQDVRAGLDQIWRAGRPAAEALNLFPMEMLQSGFWRLDPQRTLSKFAAFGRMDPDSGEARTFVTLEDWANEGPPLTIPAARELFEGMYLGDVTGKGAWQVAGHTIDPAALDCPLLNIISTSDRIVPAASAPSAGERRVLDQGHVGMIIGRRAQAALWHPLQSWLSQLR